jgi:hypothetical protein
LGECVGVSTEATCVAGEKLLKILESFLVGVEDDDGSRAAVKRLDPFSFVDLLFKYNVFGLIGVLEETISALTNL